MRIYNKIYLDNNKDQGAEKILLGYMGNDTQIEFKPDSETFFHVPYFVSNVSINDSRLSIDGATAGPFPAASDRIFENRKGYGNSSVNGTTSESETTGEWNCSWLSSQDNKWKQRIYDGASFVDVDSTMTLSPGVQYKYVRFGEKAAKQVVDSFAGELSGRLVLNIENWNENPDTIDTSINTVPLELTYNGPYTEIINLNKDGNRVYAPSLSFDNIYNIECYVPWNEKYSLTNEFTWAFWAKSPNWQEGQSTQLVGNFNSEAGAGVFIDTLSSYPFFVIPVTSNLVQQPVRDIGHLLYINENFDGYQDKQLTESKLFPANAAKPKLISLDSDNNVVIVCVDDKADINTQGDIIQSYPQQPDKIVMRKYDSKGKLLKAFNLGTLGLMDEEEVPLELFCINKRFPNSAQTPSVLKIDNKDIPVAKSKNYYKGTNKITLDKTDSDFNSINVAIGKTVTGVEIPPGTEITSVNLTTAEITLSKNLIADIILDDLFLDTYLVITDKARYYVKNDLDGFHNYSNTAIKEVFASPSTSRTAISINPVTKKPEIINASSIQVRSIGPSGEYVYNTVQGVSDLKCIGNKKWAIASDGNLYEDLLTTNLGNPVYELFYEFKDRATNFGIDPQQRLWVLHGTNKVDVFDSRYKPVNGSLFRFETGFDAEHINKNISFICCYDRIKNTKTWRSIIYYGDSGDPQVGPQVFSWNMDGKPYQTTDINSCFNAALLKSATQGIEQFTFESTGDFTGYERRRVFNQLEPYNNAAQLVLKAHFLQPKNIYDIKSNNTLPLSLQKTLIPIDDWGNNTWQHITLMYESYIKTDKPYQTLKLYINGNRQPDLTLSVPRGLEFSEEPQPSFFIGTPAGSEDGFNREIKHSSAIFNGVFEDIKIYNYCLDPNHLFLFMRKAIPAEPMYWSITTPSLQYTEQIEQIYKHKIPGAKSGFFNIKISKSGITDPKAQQIIEEEIKSRIQELKPIHTDLLNIVWVD